MSAHHQAHPWHDLHIGEQAPELVHAGESCSRGALHTWRCWVPDLAMCAVIEIPRGSKVKYELDKDTGMLFVDRVLCEPLAPSYAALPRNHSSLRACAV